MQAGFSQNTRQGRACGVAVPHCDLCAAGGCESALSWCVWVGGGGGGGVRGGGVGGGGGGGLRPEVNRSSSSLSAGCASQSPRCICVYM